MFDFTPPSEEFQNSNLFRPVQYPGDKPHFAKDAYKVKHIGQYPKGTEYIYSNVTARGANHFHWRDFNGKIVNYGPRLFVAKYLKEWWDTNFFEKPLDEVLDAYQTMCDSALGKGTVSTTHLENLHKLGYLPLRVKALPEGMLVNLRVPFMTVVNTLPGYYWLTNFIETLWSNETWKLPTTATMAYEFRRIFTKYADITGSAGWFIPYQGHCFADRGMSGHSDAAANGMAHLLSFVGSDSLESGDYAHRYHDADWDSQLILTAPPATEHAVMCANYALYGELETYRRLLTEVYPDGMCAIVSDTEDYWRVIGEVLPALKDVIMNRMGGATGPGKTVVRPDSGTPIKILCGDNEWPVYSISNDDIYNSVRMEWIHRAVFNHYFAPSLKDPISPSRAFAFFHPTTVEYILRDAVTGNFSFRQVTWPAGEYSNDPSFLAEAARDGREVWIPGSHGTSVEFQPTIEEKGTFVALWETFGGTLNDHGFKLLDEHIGAIYGDSISLESAEAILRRMVDLGFASQNAVFGIGSFAYQYVTRDTFGIAIKATHAIMNGEGEALQKKPKTDSGVKNSARGLLRVEKEGDDYVLYEDQTLEQEAQGALEVIFQDSTLYNGQSLAEMRYRLWDLVWPPAALGKDNISIKEDLGELESFLSL